MPVNSSELEDPSPPIEASNCGANFSDRLRLVMNLKGLTQAAVALRAGTTQCTVYRWLSGTRPRNDAVNTLCFSLGIRRMWLLEGEEPMEARRGAADAVSRGDASDTVAELLRNLDFDSLCGVAEASLTQIRRARAALPMELSHLSHVVEEFRRRSISGASARAGNEPRL